MMWQAVSPRGYTRLLYGSMPMPLNCRASSRIFAHSAVESPVNTVSGMPGSRFRCLAMFSRVSGSGRPIADAAAALACLMYSMVRARERRPG